MGLYKGVKTTLEWNGLAIFSWAFILYITSNENDSLKARD